MKKLLVASRGVSEGGKFRQCGFRTKSFFVIHPHGESWFALGNLRNQIKNFRRFNFQVQL